MQNSLRTFLGFLFLLRSRQNQIYRRFPTAHVDFLRKMTAHPGFAFASSSQWGSFIPAALAFIVAAWPENTAGWATVRRGYPPRNGIENAAAPVGAQFRHTTHQSLRIRVLRGFEKIHDCRPLHQLTGIHHPYAGGDPGHHPQIMGDVHDGRIELLAQIGDQIEHSRLHGHIQGRGGFIHQQ